MTDSEIVLKMMRPVYDTLDSRDPQNWVGPVF